MRNSPLKRNELLRDLPARELKRIQAISRVSDFAAGSMIIRKSDAGEHMFLVVSGRIKIFCYSNARKRKTFAYLGPGEFFGEMAVLSGAGRTASAQAVEDSRLITIDKRDFKRLLLRDTRLCYNLLRTVSERLRKANEEIESLLFRNILGRVAKAIRDLARSGGRRHKEGVLLTQNYTHQELADLVGTTREPLSRALAMLRRADLVHAERGRIHIRNPQKLESLINISVQSR